MSDIVQLYSDKSKTKKAYPKALASETYMTNGGTVESQLEHKANKNEVFSMANMGQDIKEAMTGGSVAIVGRNTILAENIVNYQVTNNKLNLPVKDLLPQTFETVLKAVNYTNGELEDNSSNARCCTADILTFTEGTTLYINDKVNTHYALVYYNDDGSFKEYVTFSNKDITFNSTVHVRIMQKYADSYTHTIENLDYFANNVYVIDKNTAISKNEALCIVEKSKDEINNDISSVKDEINNDISSVKNVIMGNLEISLKDAEIINSVHDEFIVESGNFYKYIISNKKGKYYAILKTDDLEGKFKSCINLSLYNSTEGVIKGDTIFLNEGKYLCVFNNDNTVTDYEFRLLIDCRYVTESITINEYIIYSLYNIIKTDKDNIAYVSTTGKDTNDGTSLSSAFATFQKAIDSGFTKIYAKPGTYKGQFINAQNLDSLEIKVIGEQIDYSKSQRAKAILDNSQDLEFKQDNDTGLYKYTITLPNTSNFYKVFISKELPVEATWYQSVSYNAILWETDTTDFTKDKKLVPKLTLEECKATKGTFHYDGTNIYLNPTNDITNKVYKKLIVENNELNGIYLSNVQNFIFEDIEVAYAPENGFGLNHSNNGLLNGCISHHTAYKNGFRPNNINANFYNCIGYKARTDGFGIVGGGNTNFYDCFGYYNYDDGISHHDYCTGVINGGEWHHNGKGGIAPAHGAQVDIKNTICHNNEHGIYCLSSDDRPKGFKVRHVNNVCYDNKYGITVKNYHVVSYNCKYDNNTMPKNITTNDYGSYTEL